MNIFQHNVHQMHIIQILLEKIEEYDLLIMIVLEVFEIVLKHQIQHNLLKYERIIYCMHVTMHVQQLNLILFKEL